MTCKIQLLSIVDLKEECFREIIVTIDKVGVSVTLSTGHKEDHGRDLLDNSSMFWDELNNFELLSNRYEFETVAVFKQLVTMLGKAYANRAAYEDLL